MLSEEILRFWKSEEISECVCWWKKSEIRLRRGPLLCQQASGLWSSTEAIPISAYHWRLHYGFSCLKGEPYLTHDSFWLVIQHTSQPWLNIPICASLDLHPFQVLEITNLLRFPKKPRFCKWVDLGSTYSLSLWPTIWCPKNTGSKYSSSSDIHASCAAKHNVNFEMNLSKAAATLRRSCWILCRGVFTVSAR